MNAQFTHAVKLMREEQKKFFKSAYGSKERTDALTSSKSFEKKVDDMIKEFDNNQVKMF